MTSTGGGERAIERIQLSEQHQIFVRCQVKLVWILSCVFAVVSSTPHDSAGCISPCFLFFPSLEDYIFKAPTRRTESARKKKKFLNSLPAPAPHFSLLFFPLSTLDRKEGQKERIGKGEGKKKEVWVQESFLSLQTHTYTHTHTERYTERHAKVYNRAMISSS